MFTMDLDALIVTASFLQVPVPKSSINSFGLPAEVDNTDNECYDNQQQQDANDDPNNLFCIDIIITNESVVNVRNQQPEIATSK